MQVLWVHAMYTLCEAVVTGPRLARASFLSVRTSKARHPGK